jgi:hypothetical protein
MMFKTFLRDTVWKSLYAQLPTEKHKSADEIFNVYALECILYTVRTNNKQLCTETPFLLPLSLSECIQTCCY